MLNKPKALKDEDINTNIKQIIVTKSEELLSRKQAAEKIGVTQQTLINWEKKNLLHPIRKGKRIWYPITQLDPFIDPLSSHNAIGKTANNLSQRQPLGPPPLFTSADYQTDELQPFKSQTKVIEAMIANSAENQTVLILFLSMLINLILKLLQFISADPNLVIAAYQLQDEYIQYQQSLHQFNPQGMEINDDNNFSTETQLTLLKTKPKRRIRTKRTIWQKAVVSASSIFVQLTRSANDHSLDKQERQRARDLITKILEPYQRVTRYIHDYEAGDLRHDVAMLLLLKKPKDYKLNRLRWSVRDLSLVCKTVLGTKACSKSQVGRFLKKLQWNCAIKPKMLSSDPNYGRILLQMGSTFARLDDKDVVYFGDEFKYTSSKVAQYLKLKQATAGLNISLPFSVHQPFYKTKASIQISGLLSGKTKELLLKELVNGSFDSYYKLMVEFLQEIIDKGDVEGKIYLVLDNAMYHQPKVLPRLLKQKFGNKVAIIFLPRYAANHNPIERVWKFLLETTERCGENQEEQRHYLQEAVRKYDASKTEGDLKLHCEICGQKWVFIDDDDKGKEKNLESLNKHLCFQIEGLNPYVMYVLMHGLETINLGQEVNEI